MRLDNLAGHTFGRLFVEERAPRNTSKGEARWRCRCACGQTCEVSGRTLRKGTRSCGCRRTEVLKGYRDAAGAALPDPFRLSMSGSSKQILTYRFRLMPRPAVERQFRRFAGCCRYVYNRALALQNERRARGEKRLAYVGLCKELTAWKREPELLWLAEAPGHALQQTLRNLDRAFSSFLAGRTDPPVFKKKGKAVEAFRESDPQKLAVDATNGRVKLPKVGWVRYRNSRRVEGSPKQLTVSRRAGHWYVSIQVERDVPEPAHPNPGAAVGVDVGVAAFAALSDGTLVPPLNPFKGVRGRLARLQRGLSRKVKFSKNWRKQKERVAKLHAKAANRRSDFLHKLTHGLSKNHATIVVEDLCVKGMSASAKGTVEKPGRRVRQKAGLNRAILDQGWGEFVRQLEYKAAWRGGKVVRVNPAYTSQACSRCGHTAPENRPSQAVFRCRSCDYGGHADVNAARNVLAAGQAVTACGGAGFVRPDEAGTRRTALVG